MEEGQETKIQEVGDRKLNSHPNGKTRLNRALKKTLKSLVA